MIVVKFTAASNRGVVTLSGETGISASTPNPGTARAGIRVNTDGTIDKRENTYSQIDSATDWIIPNSKARSLYEVKVTDNAATLDVASDTVGSFIALDQNREWYVTQSSVGTKTLNITLEIRYNGGSVLDSATYSGTAEVTV